MAFVRVNPSGWTNGSELTTAQLEALDADLGNSLDKGPEGDGVFGPIVVTGSVKAANGASVVVQGASLKTLSGARVQLADGDYPTLSAARTLVRDIPALFQLAGGLDHYVDRNFSTTEFAGAVGSIEVTRHLIDGSLLASVAAVFRVTNSHLAVPGVLPTLQITRRALTTGAETLIRSRIPTPATVAAWVNNNAAQTFSADIGWIVDRTQFSYWVDIYDESGANAVAGNQWHAIKLTMSNVVDMRTA